MSGCGRIAAASLLVSIVVLLGASRAHAAPRAITPTRIPTAMVPSALPPPAQVPDIGGLPCLPAFGCDPLEGLGEDALNQAAQAVLNAFGNFVADAVTSMLQELSADINATTTVQLDSAWFEAHASELQGLAVVILLPLVLVGIISAVIHRDAGQLVRTAVYIPVAIVAGGAAIGLTGMALNLTDGLTKALTGDLGTNAATALGTLRGAITTISKAGFPGTGYSLATFVMIVLLAGALLIWIELLLRTSAIYVVVAFLPLALSGLVWRGTVHWTRRMIEILVALILSKFVIVIVIDLASGMIVSGQGVTTILQGATLLLLAACAPFALLRLVPMVEAGVIGHFEGMERRPIAAATRAATVVISAVTGQVEVAAASGSLQDNGGGGGGVLSQTLTDGGELNNVDPPDGWSSSTPPSAEVDGGA